jgi:hypothetical protein
MFNLHKASFIPQANSQKKEPELSDLVVVKEEKKIEWDLMFLPEQNRWKIKPSFLVNDLGYTAALQDGYLFLLQTGEDAVEILKPKFLKGLGNLFTSNYFNLLAVQAGFSITEKCYLFLTEQETGIENVKAYLITKEIPNVVLPSVEELPVLSIVFEEKTLEEDSINKTDLF